jgi:ADP-ribosyl-[dinitrogen reductase] hydrolase
MPESPSPRVKDKVRRLQNALWGLFAGDALAMPVHWYYNIANIYKDFEGGVTTYAAPRHPHPESFMAGMPYHPDVESACRLGRPFDILHEHARFYDTNYAEQAVAPTERETEHGHLTPALKERYHYHHGLRAGENTLGAHLVRVLMRQVVRLRRYDPAAFLDGFVAHLATPGANRDPYTEIYLRRWFEHYSQGLPAHACAQLQRFQWSVSGHGGVIRPLLVSLLAPSPYQGLGLAVEHQNLTHRSETVAMALSVLVPLVHALASGEPALAAMARLAKDIRLPRVTGEKLFTAYKSHQGPDNIPAEEMWRLHNDLADAPFDLVRFVSDHEEKDFVKAVLATACYPEHGLPLMLALAHKHGGDLEATLLANANAGGDNVHRGMILGLTLGAAAPEIPAWMRDGLADRESLAGEIEAFAAIAARGDGF